MGKEDIHFSCLNQNLSSFKNFSKGRTLAKASKSPLQSSPKLQSLQCCRKPSILVIPNLMLRCYIQSCSIFFFMLERDHVVSSLYCVFQKKYIISCNNDYIWPKRCSQNVNRNSSWRVELCMHFVKVCKYLDRGRNTPFQTFYNLDQNRVMPPCIQTLVKDSKMTI